MAVLQFSDILSEFDTDPGNLIPLLQRVQQEVGYISEESVAEISRHLKCSENEIYGVATFYSQFRFNAPGRNSIRICLGTACHVRGGQNLAEALQREIGIAPGETTADGRFDLDRVACLGCCALAPVVQVNGDIYGQMTINRLRKILDQYE